ncbi:MAG: hypothetical protein CSA40_00470 [Flavobacteriales bacterium]|nr:MAG: hypothetical protein CSA40_00470 [Flavobacteriales bacterium]
MKNIFFLICGLLITLVGYAQNRHAKDWEEDLDYISQVLPQVHYDLYAVKNSDYFLHGIKNIKSSVDQLSDFQIVVRLQQLIASMGDSHTNVNFGQLVDKDKVLPLYILWFSDGLYILHTTPEHEEILGHRIISINQTPIEQVIDSLSSLVTVDNPSSIKSSMPNTLLFVQILEDFKITKDSKIILGLEDLHRTRKNYRIEPELMTGKNRKVFKPDSLALCFKNKKAYFIDYYQAHDKIYYIQYNKCWSKELDIKYRNGKDAEKIPSFNEFEENIFKNLKTKPIDKIVFDLRFNGGGNSSQGTAFIEKFAHKNPDIKIFVVLGRHTFSSAIINAMDFKKMTNATFVGEATKGKPNHYGDVKNFELPHSGLRINYSTKYFKRSAVDMNSLEPEVEKEMSFRDYKKGIDPVYDWIREQ